MEQADFIVVGAGMVGSAIGYGLAQTGAKVLLLDGGDRDFRAARANFGLVWVQGKGPYMPAYSNLSRDSSDMWPEFRATLADTSGQQIDYQRDGGLFFCIGEVEFDKRRDLLHRMHNQHAHPDTEMVERAALERMLPKIRLGPDVTGASFGRRDGHVNPLQLLEALHRAIQQLGGRILYRSSVTQIEPDGAGFRVSGPSGTWQADKVVVAAGLATDRLTRPLGLAMPLRAERGQILVTERLASMFPYPASGIRQTAEGTLMLGATNEDVGLDSSVTSGGAIFLAQRALRVMPDLARARLVRHWAGLRVLTPDTYSIYEQSKAYPGLYAAICHSAVTLAAVHTKVLAPAIAEGRLSDPLVPFSTGRFDVQETA